MSAGAAAAAAAEAARRNEEEEMTKYSDGDLQGEWEFKILRSNFTGFRKPDMLRQACAEEAIAGWILLEKFDDQRLRFKRPISARANDSALEIDPYRTVYGAGGGAVVGVILLITVLAIAGVFMFAFMMTRK